MTAVFYDCDWLQIEGECVCAITFFSLHQVSVCVCVCGHNDCDSKVSGSVSHHHDGNIYRWVSVSQGCHLQVCVWSHDSNCDLQFCLITWLWLWFISECRTAWQCDVQLYLIKQWLWSTGECGQHDNVIYSCIWSNNDCDLQVSVDNMTMWFTVVSDQTMIVIYRHKDCDLQVCAWFAGVCVIFRCVHDLQVCTWFAGVCMICRWVHSLQVCAWFAGVCMICRCVRDLQVSALRVPSTGRTCIRRFSRWASASRDLSGPRWWMSASSRTF